MVDFIHFTDIPKEFQLHTDMLEQDFTLLVKATYIPY